MSKIAIGSKVAYSVQFLKSIGCSHSNLARGRGEVIEIKDYGIKLAKINWNDPEIPELVNINNLAIVGPNTKFCQC